MKIKLLLFCLYFFCLHAAFAAGDDSLKTLHRDWVKNSKAPSIGYNIGYLNFFGDVKLNGYKPPFGTRLGHQFFISKPLSPSLALSFNFFAGKVFGEETRGTDNLNFRTSLFGQSLALEYNFRNIIKPSADSRLGILPLIGVGAEALVFRGKADMQNDAGQTYYYWNDGTIKDLPELPQNIDNAVITERDHVYETELRDANLDGFGKYSQITFAMPFMLGADLKVGNNLGFRVATTFHYTFSDMLDNVSSKGSGNRQGNAGKDMFLFSSVGINYRFGGSVKKEKPADADEDGIADVVDKCRDTPKGIKVDKQGCPEVNEKDRDADGVLDVVDRCRETAPGEKVNKEGCSENQLADADTDGVMNALDKCADTPAGSKVDAKGCPVEETVVEEKGNETPPEQVESEIQTEETKPADAKGIVETEQKPVKAAEATIITETKPAETKETEGYKNEGKYHFADLNKNGEVEIDEVNEFIDRMFDGDKKVTIQTIDEILEYYFNQE